MTNFKNKKVAVLGYGVEGQSGVKWLLKKKAKVTICDQNPDKYRFTHPEGVQWRVGKNYLKNLEGFDIIVRSPGVPYLTEEIQQAQKKGVKITSATNLFFDLCPAKIIGVTGTKGKGTTTSLIAAILNESGKKVKLLGNIGQPMLDQLPKIKKSDWVVLELSSFQLQDLHKSPHIAVVLDIKEDHLDHHKNRREYVQAKENIVRHQTANDFAVVNADYFTSFSFAAASKAKTFFFSRRKLMEEGAWWKWSREPALATLIISPDGEQRTENRGQKTEKFPSSDFRHPSSVIRHPFSVIRFEDRGFLEARPGFARRKTEKEIIKTNDLHLRGLHNLENIAAAALASYLAGAQIRAMQKILKNFKGLEHRLELVRELNGVKFYNDSIATTPEAGIASLNAFFEPIILIAGGSEKKANYQKLGRKVAQKCQAAILIGQTASRIKKAIPKSKSLKIITGLKKMKEIVKTAYQLAKKGDVILLAP
ncbi:UDP-N-acetylmuramoyl-L-alanine--D-glutamate ligase, partial [Candidatus Berkelbacteria bacterium]|nr:UDP-N-acetylmuramoyl-L-alanine--D-glutamate ligase [Candidatus Berkelbacteria bacterium]